MHVYVCRYVAMKVSESGAAGGEQSKPPPLVHIYIVCKAVLFMWGLLRLTPIKQGSLDTVKHVQTCN